MQIEQEDVRLFPKQILDRFANLWRRQHTLKSPVLLIT